MVLVRFRLCASFSHPIMVHPCSPSHFYVKQGGVTRSNEECCPCRHHGLGANKLIRAIGAPLSDFLGEYSWNIPKNLHKSSMFKKNLCIILLRFVLKICQKYVIFKVFQVHLQVLLLLKSSGYKSFYITFEGLNVNKIISYFGHS
jgi:hypothetical protein